jgi:hypothetical protein
MLTTYVFLPVTPRMPKLTARLSAPPTEHEPCVDPESSDPKDRPHDNESDAGASTNQSNLGDPDKEDPATS